MKSDGATDRVRSSLYLILVVLMITILFALKYTEHHRNTEESQSSNKWDYIIFSQQWPMTSCIDHKERHHGATCNLYRNMTTWTVHGLWPTKIGTRGPTNCNSSWPFIESHVADLEPLMLKYWTNIFADTGKLSLWEHEWTKHGTCAAELAHLDNEHKYFHQGLQWVQQFNLVVGLAQQGIEPSDNSSYTNDQIFGALRSIYGTEPIVDCVYDSITKRHMLAQVKLCFDRDLFLQTCSKHRHHTTQLTAKGNCPATGIYYPSIVRYGGNSYRWEKQCTTLLCQALYAVHALNITPL